MTIFSLDQNVSLDEVILVQLLDRKHEGIGIPNFINSNLWVEIFAKFLFRRFMPWEISNQLNAKVLSLEIIGI